MPLADPHAGPVHTQGDFMSKLVRVDTGASCILDADAWWAPDQPSYVWASNNSNYGHCLGYSGMPDVVPCNGSHPLVNRMCRCSPDKTLGSTAPPPSVDGVDAQVPWGTEWFGRTSDMDGYFWNFPMPFYKRWARCACTSFHNRASSRAWPPSLCHLETLRRVCRMRCVPERGRVCE